MDGKYEGRVRFLINVAFAGMVVLLVFVVLRFFLPAMLPFTVGLLISFLLKPITAVLTRNTAFRRRSAALLVLGAFYLVVTGLILTVLAVIFTQLGALLHRLPEIYTEQLEPMLFALNRTMYDLLNGMDTAAASRLGAFSELVMSTLQTAVQELSALAIGLITGALRGLPMFVTTLLFTIISSVLISADYNVVTGFIVRQLSPKYKLLLLESKDFMMGSLFRLVRAYVMILAITMTELSIGLWILGVDYFFAIAVVIALLDILPLIGTAGVLIPWGLFQLARGDLWLGVGLLVLLAVVTLVRNLIEPKIVGAQIGLHPIITIAAMYFGLRLFGFLGLIMAPLGALMIKYLNDNNRIHLYK